MLIQHEETGRITELPDSASLPEGWFKVPSQCPYGCPRCQESAQECASCVNCGYRWSEENYGKTGAGVNVLVAERVMGWTPWDIETGEDCPCEPGVTYFADWGDMGGVAVYTPPHLTGDVEYYFNPAEDIGDAWKVIKKARGWDDRRRHWFTVRLRWAVEDRTGDVCLEAHVILKAEPADICKAALEVINRAD